MKNTFVDNLSKACITNPILISGNESKNLKSVKYLLIEQEAQINAYEIRYEYSCSPFQSVMLEKDILAVGFEEYFYLFDLINKLNILSLRLDGYFGDLYLDNDLFYVADAFGLHCINKSGRILWQNRHIAIDGIIIEKFETNKIYGRGQQDPPD